ncbi:MAG: hypothetical protein ACLTK0_10080 [Anaerovoracaceae bacterium]
MQFERKPQDENSPQSDCLRHGNVGDEGTVTAAVKRAVEEADIVIGARRLFRRL